MSSSDSDSEEEVSGMIRSTLVHELRAILDEYPDNGQILKELIQNAEDAGATEIKIILDSEGGGEETYCHPHLNGPSLYVYNDALFTEKDWMGIKMLRKSVKEEDPLKVGRFGLGFKSVFHITDYPSVLSGETLLFLDPSKPESEVCSLYSLRKSGRTTSALIRSQSAVFDYLHAQLADKRHFHGTLFRFPLRIVPSELSTLTHNRTGILNLMNICQTEFEFVLIFLKSLTKVELIHFQSDSTKSRSWNDLAMLPFDGKFSVLLHQESTVQRKCLKQSLKKALVDKVPYFSTSDMLWDVEKQDVRGNVSHTCKVTNVYLAREDMSTKMRTLCDDSTLSYCPYVGVAFMDLEEQPLVKGHVFCFLPLPLQASTMTGLPVFLNGFFALSSNRHHLKWPTADEESVDWEMQTDKAYLWNYCLITEALPKAYRKILLELKQDCRKQGNTQASVSKFYKALPNPSSVSHMWKPLVDKLYPDILCERIFWTKCDGGKWVRIRKAVFILESNSEDEKIGDIMILLHQNICSVPDHILNALLYYNPGFTVLNPNLVRRILKNSKTYQPLPNSRKLDLLGYILRDIDEDSFPELVDIELIPLADGSFTTFTGCVYIDTTDFPMSLFPSLENQFLADVPGDIKEHMERISQFEDTCLQIVLTEEIPSLITEVLMGSCAMSWEWVLQLWTMLYRNFSDCLDEFENINILPTGDKNNFRLNPLTTSNILVLKKWNGLSLNADIEEFVVNLGVKVVYTIPQEVIKHPLIFGAYIFEPSSKTLLDAMINADVRLKEMRSMEMNQRQRTAFISLISQYPGVFSKVEKRLLTSLKLFHVQTPSGKGKFCSIEAVSIISSTTRIPVTYCSSILDPRTADERSLALRLGASELTYTDMVLGILENMAKYDTLYSAKEIRETVLSLLPQFQNNKDINWKLVKKLAFIPCSEDAKAALRKPSDLFDPSDRILADLFVGEDVFPQQEFSGHISVLKDLGLKTIEAVTSEDLLRSAEVIHTNRKNLPDDSLQVKSDAVICILASMPNMTTAILSKVREFKFLPKSRKPRHVPPNFNWFEDTALFYSPTSLVAEDLDRLYGSVLPVVKLPEKLTDQEKNCLHTRLQFIICPSLDLIVKQLKVTIGCWNCKAHEVYIEAVKCLYKHLTTYDDGEVFHAFEDHDMISKEWVWTGDKFSSPFDVYLTCQKHDVTLKPFKHFLPQDMSHLEHLLLLFGSDKSQNNAMYLEVLELIGDSIERGEIVRKQQTLQMVVSILQALVDKDNEDLLETDFDQILLPVQADEGDDFLLKPLRQCVNSDKAQWSLEQPELESESEDPVYHLHKAIPHSLSKTLRVPSLMDKLLDTHEIDMNFGQHESLTQRLKNLTGQYTDGMAIVKELIQNADDAKANTICFLYDERENLNARKGLLHNNLSEFQGPALWTFNNAEFSDNDFQNITKISGATKEDDTTKIGRFGLGFNAVYNLTDVPSFISRDNFVIFDPHRINLDKPGMRFNIKKNKGIMKRLADQFQPFDGIFGYDLSPDRQQNNVGTLFRFPLRTCQQANCSEIRQVEYTRNEMIHLIQLCLGSLGDLLLFTQHVKELHFYHLPKYEKIASNHVLLFSASKMLRESMEFPLINQTPLEEMKKRYDNKQEKNQLSQAIRISTNSDNNKCVELGLPVTESQQSVWLTNWSTGQDKGRKFLNVHQNIKGIMPVATVAVPLDFEERPYKIIQLTDNPPGFSKISFIYNFLPMPIRTKLPVVINGSFVVSSDRQGIVTKSVDEKHNTGSEWNKVLLEDSVSSAYVDLLLSLTELIPFHKDVFDFWPTQENCEEMLRPLLESFYSSVVLDQPKILPGIDTWVSFDSSVFLEDGFQTIGIRRNAFRVLQKVLSSSGKTVVDMPNPILNLFPKKKIDSRTIFAKEFYQNWLLPQMDNIDKDTRDELVLFALRRNEAELLEILKGSQCIPVYKTRHMLCCPSDLIHPDGRIAELYDDTDYRFPAETFRDPLILNTLCELGMLKDELPNNEMPNRANSIACLSKTDKNKAKNRFHSLLNILVLPLPKVRSLSLEEKSAIGNIPFIPVSRRPTDWPKYLAWKGDSMFWACPRTVHSWRKRQLIGCEKPVCERLDYDQEIILASIGILERPSPDDVIIQLQHLSDTHGLEGLGQHVLQEIYESIYDFIESSFKRDDPHCWLAKLANIKYIYVNRRHVEARRIQFWKTRYDCEPYLFYLPGNYALKFKKTMNLFGVKDRFSIDDIRMCLDDFFSNCKGNRLQNKDIHVLNCIMLLLVQTSTDSGTMINWDDEGIMLPDQTGTLYPLSMLCFNDCSWIEGSTELVYIHKIFCEEIADVLGVKTSQAWCAAQYSEGMAIPFGQREQLTTRLNGLLNGYPCDETIFKELVQNADDSGASCMVFIKDLRHHKKEQVFSDNWKCLQGPALCVYTDKPFSDKDLEGIQSLGKGSKSEDQLKTGKYGVGFNSVYHITDVPSFITKTSDEEILCVLDPNRKYVPNMTPSLCGMRYNKLDVYRKRFPDVFSCYPQKIMKESGTLFRFPLRTKDMATMSAIKQKDFTKAELEDMLSRFQKEAKECILFLKAVRRIQFLAILDNGEIVTDLEVNATLISSDNRHNYNHGLQEVAASLNSGVKLQDIQPKAFRSSLKIEEKGKRKKTKTHMWHIEHRIGFENVEHLPDNLLEAFNSGEIRCLPTAGIAFLLRPTIYRKYTAFRHLPLPIVTHLPVAIDAHFVLDHENRRSIYSSQNQDLSATWNLKLVENLLAPLYASALLNMVSNKTLFPEQITRYYNYFPNCEKTSDLWKTLSLFTYKYLDGNSSPVLVVSNKKKGGQLVQRWLPPTGNGEHKAFFNTLDKHLTTSRPLIHFFQHASVPDDTLTDIIKRLDFNLVNTPNWILRNFRAAEVNVNEVNASAIIEYLRENYLAVNLRNVPIHIQETNFESKESLLKLLSYTSSEVSNLELLPLRLTCDQKLYFFQSSDPVYFCEYHSAWNNSSNRFLDVDVACKMRITNTSLEEHDAVVPLMISDLNILLPLEIDSKFVTDHPIDWASCWSNIPSMYSQIRQIWIYLQEQVTEDFAVNQPRHLLQCISKWPLIPVTRVLNGETSNLLAPISFANQIICESQHDKGVQENLKAQGMLILEKNYNVLPSLVISTSDARILLQGITLMLASRPQCTSYHQVNQFVEILHYFARSDSLTQLQSDQTSKDQLKMLPFYLTLSDTAVALSGYSALALDSSIPLDGVEKVARKHHIVLLKYNLKLMELYEYLNVSFPTVIDFYCSYLLKWFSDLDEEDRMTHLVFIRDTLVSNAYNGSLQTSLKMLNYIRHNGILKTANYFYDHQHPLFKVMMDSNTFVPYPFCQRPWHQMLKLSGLITTVSSDLFVSLTKQLEAEANNTRCDMDKVKKKSMELVYHLFKSLRNKKCYDTGVATQICAVRFLVSGLSDSTLEMYGQSHQKGNRMICFQGSFNPNHTKLIWTVSEILPEYANCKTGQLPPDCCKALGVPNKPSVNAVVTNLMNIIRTVESSNILQTSINDSVMEGLVDLFKKHYEFLHKRSSSELQRLANSKCILIPKHKCLARSDMVVQSLRQKNLHPYLFSQPTIFGPFDELFKTLGVAEEDSIRHYVNVLRIIKESAGDNILHANDLKAVIEALRAILQTLSDEAQDLSEEISALYLPVKTDKGSVLMVSTKVVISDRNFPQSLQKQFNVLADLDDLDTIKLCKLLPKKHKPQLVSELVVEELLLECMYERAKTPTAGRLQDSVTSTEFLNGVVRLLKSSNVAGVDISDDQLETVEKGLCSVRVFSVSVIETHLIYKGTVLPDTCTEKPTSFANKCEETSEIHITFNTVHLENESFDKFTNVATVLCEHLPSIGGINRAILLFPKLLQLVFNNESVSDYLDQEGFIQLSDHKKTKPLLPRAGTYIPIDLHFLLDARFTFFEKGEYVGYEVCDPLLDDEEGDPVFIYAIIEEQIETPESRWNWQMRYRINIGQDIVEVSATDLYKFYRKSVTVSSDVEIYTGPSVDTPTPPVTDKTLKQVKQDIFEMLKAAWEDERQRKKVIKRLLLTWHPDKNVGNEDFCTKVTQFLMMLLERFKAGNFANVENDDDVSERSGFQDAWFQRNRGFYKKFYERTSRRAHTSRQRDFSFDSTDSSNRSRANPQPTEGRRWFRQAQADFQSIPTDATPCWVSFKCQQVVEKALKALVYTRNANSSVIKSHNLNEIAREACSDNIVLLDMITQLLEILGGNCYLSTRYPDTISGSRIPDDVYRGRDTRKAYKLCGDILQAISRANI